MIHEGARSPSEFLGALRFHRDYEGQAVHVEELAEKPAAYQSLDQPLDRRIAGALRKRGIERFYVHQAQAIDAARRSEHVVVATSTASGKSLCYSIPAIESLLADKTSRTLLLFPTKALAQDQLRSLRAFLASAELGVEGDGRIDPVVTFDGDTPQVERALIRQRSRMVLTNPDMLHLGILPNHAMWSSFLRNLRYVVVDEAHVYRGVFGSHVANILRRLRRICTLYGAKPVFIASSATIAKPGEHFLRLVGEPATVVEEDGSPHGPKQFVFWNPPVSGADRRRSANAESADLLAGLVRAGMRTIAFTKTRKLAELVSVYARDKLAKDRPDLAERIASYRAGYTAADRRDIERRLFDGQLLGVSATNALELGVDIGDLTATVMTGFPGSIASTWQQAGRSGRGRDESLAFLVGLDNPLDQYLMRNPATFFDKGHEEARINPSNRRILAQHVLCAAHEAAITLDDLDWFGEGLLGAINDLAESSLLRKRAERWFPAPSVDYPAADVDIRSASGATYDLMSGGRTIETIEAETAFFQIHPGAIYLHQGETLIVDTLDLVGKVATARPTDAAYYTQTEEQTSLEVIRSFSERPAGLTTAHLGDVVVTNRVLGYKRKRQFGDEVLGRESLELPESRFETEAVWWTVPPVILRAVEQAGLDVAGGLHAAEHGCIGLLPLYAMCDRRDIGGLSSALHPDTAAATVFIYDGHAGGVGIAERGYEEIESLWRSTLDLVRGCPCEDGCPSCIQSPKCGNNNDTLDKAAAVLILERLLGGG